MTRNGPSDEVCRAFGLHVDDARITRFGRGLINDTFMLVQPGGERFVLQRVNEGVFADANALMHNADLVARHLASVACPIVVPHFRRTPDGAPLVSDATGAWRVADYIPGTRTRLAVRDPADAGEVAQAFGCWHAALANLDAASLIEVLPGFHDGPARLAAFERVVQDDPVGRVDSAEHAIDHVARRSEWADALADVDRSRVVHNDAKVSNVLFDERTDRAVAIVDLDTTMAGTVLHDVGDMLRSMASPASEEERDLGRVVADLDLVHAILRSYVDATRGVLSDAERALLFDAGIVIAFEQSVRFLTDYIEGDRYYRVADAQHNLARSLNQLQLLESLLDVRSSVRL